MSEEERVSYADAWLYIHKKKCVKLSESMSEEERADYSEAWLYIHKQKG